MVERAEALTSPAYDLGASEEEVRQRWGRHYGALGRGEVEHLSARDRRRTYDNAN